MYNDKWEQNMFVAVEKSADEVKAELFKELEVKRVGSSVINQSVDEINNTGFINMENPFAGSGNEKNNARVRTMDGPTSNRMNNIVVPTSNNYNGTSSTDDNGYGMLGSATTLILICVAILIVLIAGVSFMIMNFVGF